MSSSQTSDPVLYTRSGMVGEAEATAPRSGTGSRAGASAVSSSPEPTSRRSSREALPLPPDPYPGLRPFTHNESRLFCGRVMERLRLLNLLAESDFVAVLGSSGSGKSSLVLSGLIPDIRSGKLAGTPAAGMEFATFRPGRNPYANLAAALYKTWLGEGLPDPFFIEENLRRSPLTLAQMCVFKEKEKEKTAEQSSEEIERLMAEGRIPSADVKVTTRVRTSTSVHRPPVMENVFTLDPSEHKEAAPPAPPRSLIIVVDQFEEIFRFASLVAKEQDEESATRRDFRPVAGELDEAQAFISLLLSAARDSSGLVRVVITMRSDFFKHCEVFEGLPKAIAAHQFITPRMCREQMEDAIQMPLDHFGSTISEELVNEMLNDVHGEFDQLPVLQHALARMWHQAKALRPPQPAELTAEDYRRAGRLSGAMNAHGDELITNNQLIPAQVASFFRCLGDFDPTSGQAIRRPRTVAQISAESALSIAEICRIATVFAHPEASFITATPALPEPGALPEGDIIIDLTHECLLRKWQACTEWMRQEKREGDALKSLSQRMQDFEWNGHRSVTGDHLTPGQYQRFAEVLPDLRGRPQAWGQRYGCDVAQPHLFLAVEKKHVFWQRWRRPVIGAAFLLIGLVSVALVYRANAQTALEKAHNDRFMAEKEMQMAQAKATVAAARFEADKAAAEAVAARAESDKMRAEADATRTAASAQLNIAQRDAQKNTISMVGDLKSKLAEVQAGKDEFGSLITTLIAEARVDHEKLPEKTRQKLDELGFLPGRNPASLGTPSAQISLSSTRKLDNFPTSWAGRQFSTRLFTAALLPVTGAAEPWQYHLFTGGRGGLWRHLLAEQPNEGSQPPAAASREDPAAEPVWDHEASTLSISTLPDSRGWIAATSDGPQVGLSKDGGKSWLTIKTRQDNVTCALVLAGGRLVYGTRDGSLGVIDVTKPVPEDSSAPIYAQKGHITDVAINPDGTLLVTSGDDARATLWSMQSGTLAPADLGEYSYAHGPVRGASFSPNGRWLLLPTEDKIVRLCLLHPQGADTKVLKAFTLIHDNPVVSGAFSPDGRWIATADTSGKVYIWRSIPIPYVETKGRGYGAAPLLDAQQDLPLPAGIFTGHTAPVSALAWAPNNAGLATADETGAVIVWRLQVGATVAGVPLIMPTAAQAVDALAWSPDSSLLATADMSGTAQVHPLAFHLRTTVALENQIAANILYIPAKGWPADFADVGFLSDTRVSLRNPATGASTLAGVALRNGVPSFGLSQGLATQLGLAPDAEAEISISKLINQKGPPDDGTVRLKTARFILRGQYSGGAGEVLQILTGAAKNQAQPILLATALSPVLYDWLSVFAAEGMNDEAETALIDYYASQTDSVSRWLEVPKQSQMAGFNTFDPAGNLITSDDPGSDAHHEMASAIASYNALQTYIRWMVYFFGATPTAKRIQTALDDLADGVVGPATKTKLMQNCYSDVLGLLDKLDKVNLRPETASISPLIATQKQAARTFAKSFLGPATTSAADQRLIDRARSAIGKATQYQLGEGGMDPTAPHPASGGKCDNSGFIAWVLGQSRLTKDPLYTTASNDGGWMDVTSIQKDITTAGGMLSQVTEPYPGCIAAYGSGPDTPRNAALITAVIMRDGRTIPGKLINCTKENWTQKKDAIQEIPADGFLANPTTAYGHFDPPKP